MRVLAACSLGGAGHLRPLMPLLDEARRSGHETLVVCPPALTVLVAATDHPYRIGGEPPEGAVRPIREALPVVSGREASILGNRELFGRLATTAMLPAMEAVLQEWRPDVVLRDPCEYASAVAAGPLQIATVQVAIGMAEIEWASIDVAAPELEGHRHGLVGELRRSPYVTRFPVSLDPSPFADTKRFSEPPPQKLEALPDWWAGSRAPLVYVSFGTVLGHMTFAEQVYQTAIDALAGVEARVLLTVGHRFDASALTEVPDHVHVEAWVDQAQVSAEADLVVCHGGSGTTFGALAAGVPVIVVPMFADQFTNGPRIAQAGAGLVAAIEPDAQGRRRPLRRADAASIRRAVETVLAQASYGQGAKALAAEMNSAPTIRTTLEEILPRL